MRPSVKLVLSTAIAVCSLQSLRAQDLSPRAYVITPLHSNAVILTWSFYHGTILFDGTAPVTGATGTYHVSIFSYYHSFSACFSSIILSPPNSNVKMSPHERKDIRVESEGTATSERDFQLR